MDYSTVMVNISLTEEDADMPLSDAEFIAHTLTTFCRQSVFCRVLDVGCGGGGLVRDLQALGFDAWGCDSVEFGHEHYAPSERLKPIEPFPYRLPFGDNTFDAVVSTSVLEHARNKEELFREVHRVLKPGGATFHLYPSKWILPREPHMYVPLVNWMWPNVPDWWLSLWAIIGIRNEFQTNLPWRETVKRNKHYCENRIHYWNERTMRRTVRAIFGNCAFPCEVFQVLARPSTAPVYRALPFLHRLRASVQILPLVAFKRC